MSTQVTDTQGFLIWLLAIVAKILAGFVLWPWSLCIVIKEKRVGAYFRNLGIGWDILAGKAFEPVFNKKLKKPNCGRDFGGNETISHDMAVNKLSGCDTEEARWVEENLIEFFDKNHLAKTAETYGLVNI